MSSWKLIPATKKTNQSLYPSDRGFPGGLMGKEFTCNARDTEEAGSVPELGRSPGGGHDNPLQYSSLENPMDRDRGPWRATMRRVLKSWT